MSQFDMRADSGIGYRIFVAVPGGAAPTEGFPVVYLIDGNFTFPSARKVLASTPEMQAIVVGIGYPTEDRQEIVGLRYFDLTPPTPAERMPLMPGADAPRTGGQAAFVRFLEAQLKPEIERRLPVNRMRQALFGHSLGGLLTLHVLFSHPAAFHAYAASDPSVWWNGRSLLEEQSQFLQARADEAKGKRLLIETSGRRVPHPGGDAAANARLAQLRGGPGGRDIHEALQQVAGLDRVFKHYPDESHGSLIAVSVADALRFFLLDAATAEARGGKN